VKSALPSPRPPEDAARVYAIGSLEAIIADVVRRTIQEVLREERTHTPTEQAPRRAEDVYVTVHEAAEIARVGDATVRRWQKLKFLGRYRAGRQNRVKLSELHAFLARENVSTPDLDVRRKARDILAGRRTAREDR